MKLKFFVAALGAVVITGSAFGQGRQTPPDQGNGGYVFTDVKINDVTPVKNQASSGTCWSFGTLAAVESQLMKEGKGETDLAEMWIVRNAYFEKVKNYIRMRGNANLGAGGVASDIPYIIERYGIVPEEVYPGLNYGTETHNHGEIDGIIKAFADAMIKSRKPTIAWENALNAILDTYFGERPENFTYKGKQYTPKSFASAMGIVPSDFIQISSFTHHPFYQTFVLEVPDNWTWDRVYNVPIEELEGIIDAVLEKGYTVSWASDVSERGYQYNKGFAVVPTTNVEDLSTTEKARWTTYTAEELNRMTTQMEGPMPELKITQELRQQAFDNFETTDDHSMQIVGVAKDQNGTKFYKVKNSWGQGGAYGGYFYASVPYVLYKTTAVFVNKNVIPDATAKKLGLR